MCLAAFAAALLLEQGVTVARGAADVVITGAFASFAAQLYLVAGIRKVRSRHFMSGRVIVDNIAYDAYHAAAGNRDFLPMPRLPALAILLRAQPFSLPAAPPRY